MSSCWCLVDILKLMLGRYSEDQIWSRFVFELVIWPKQVTLVSWTQPSGPLCLLQCFFLFYNHSNVAKYEIITCFRDFMRSYPSSMAWGGLDPESLPDVNFQPHGYLFLATKVQILLKEVILVWQISGGPAYCIVYQLTKGFLVRGLLKWSSLIIVLIW